MDFLFFNLFLQYYNSLLLIYLILSFFLKHCLLFIHVVMISVFLFDYIAYPNDYYHVYV